MCILVLENFKGFSSQWQGIFPGKAISFLGLVGSLIILKQTPGGNKAFKSSICSQSFCTVTQAEAKDLYLNMN